jgi:two-component system nitrogen regulation response regulator GlnG
VTIAQRPSGDLTQPTLSASVLHAESLDAVVPALTVVWHPDARMIGAQCPLPQHRPTPLNRFTPLLRTNDSGEMLPLAHPIISRQPLLLLADAEGGVSVTASQGRMTCELQGHPLLGSAHLSAQEVRRGAMLVLSGRVALCLHHIDTVPQRSPRPPELVGISSPIERLARQIRIAAPTALPVLILGESGTGKELVAQALHRGSPRASAAMVCVNMAALSESLATAELFGAVRGAYTGSQSHRQGLWAQADRSSLFLDEIGDTPTSVQPMLLRALETGEIRAVGASSTTHCDVRLIAATDRSLENASFNQPLRRRLEGYVIRTPTLRDRREDLGVLARHLLARADAPPSVFDCLPSALLRAFCLHAWLGNVRQLSQAMQRLALGAKAGCWPSVEEFLGEALTPCAAQAVVDTAPVTPAHAAEEEPPQPPRYRSPSDVDGDMVLNALNENQWCVRRAAQALGVSRASFYNLLRATPGVQSADSLTLQTIREAMAQGDGTLEDLAARLRTPREALRRRMRTLGLAQLQQMT